MFVNLLLNGIEAMPQGGTLPWRSVPTSGGVCRITVCDSGAAFPAVLERIFEPFVTSKERGTGLGLAISRRLAAEHAGTLTGSQPPRRWGAVHLGIAVAGR